MPKWTYISGRNESVPKNSKFLNKTGPKRKFP